MSILNDGVVQVPVKALLDICHIFHLESRWEETNNCNILPQQSPSQKSASSSSGRTLELPSCYWWRREAKSTWEDNNFQDRGSQFAEKITIYLVFVCKRTPILEMLTRPGIRAQPTPKGVWSTLKWVTQSSEAGKMQLIYRSWLFSALPPSDRPACWLSHVPWLSVSKSTTKLTPNRQVDLISCCS